MPTIMDKQPSPPDESQTGADQDNSSNGKIERKDKRACPFHKNATAREEKTDNVNEILSSHDSSTNVFLKDGLEYFDEEESLNVNENESSLTESSNECSLQSSPVQNGHSEPLTQTKVSHEENTADPVLKKPTAIESNDTEEAKKDPKSEFAPLSLKLLLPGHTEAIDIMHVAKDTVNDLLQYAFERPDSCYRTCFSIRLNGKKLDNFTELGSIQELKNGSTIELVEEPYALRDVLIHIQRLQELLQPNLLQQSFSFANGMSLSFLSSLIKDSLDKSGDSKTDQSFPLPPDNIMTAKDISLSGFYPSNINESFQVPECLKSLSFSVWNPPPANRKFKGDILYLDIKTLEGEDFCVTACPAGFYLNKCILDVTFDPSPRKIAHHCQHLVTLLQQISGIFRKNYSLLQKQAEKKNGYEVFPVPYPVYPWVIPKLEPKPSVYRTDETMGLKIHSDELLVGQVRDWNEEMQATKELPITTLQHRFFKDRALFKVHSDFVQAAVRGAKAAIDGQLHPLNPADQERHHMYLWNNIFFSTGFDGRGHFKDFGGDEAGHAAANYDLQGVEIVEALNIKGLCTLGAVLIDYRGYRIFAQSIVPGLLQREHESSIVYGTMDSGKTFKNHEKFQELLKRCGEELHHRPHKIVTDSNEEVELPMSLEVKGIEGTDGRLYILDLFRILPPDINYADASQIEKSELATPTGQPNVLRHKLYTLRPELVDSFLRMSRRIALELHMFQKMKKSLMEAQSSSSNTVTKCTNEEQDQTDKEKAEAETIDATENSCKILNEHLNSTASNDNNKDNTSSLILFTDDNQKLLDTSDFSKLLLVDGGIEVDKTCQNEDAELIKGTTSTLQNLTSSIVKTSNDVQSETDESANDTLINLQDLDFKFNPDIFAPGVSLADPPEQLEKDRKLVKDISTYLSDTVIPKFIRDCIVLQVSPIDGTALKTQLHTRGINLRYIGVIAALAGTREDLSHLHRICVSEMVLRTAKRRFCKVLLSTPFHRTVAAVSHVLNCLFTGIEENLSDESSGTKKKPKRKRSNKEAAAKTVPNNKDVSFMSLTQAKLWKLILEDISSHYRFTVNYTSLSDMCHKLNINKLSLLREFSIKTGMQIAAKDYKFSSATPFQEDDILSLTPVVKHTYFKPIEAASLFDLAQVRLQSGNLKAAHELLTEAVQLFSQVYGPLHSDIAGCYRAIARIHHALGENNLAVQYQYKAVFIFERVHGVDHFCTISAYFLLAQYCCAAGKNKPALTLLYHTRYLVLLIHGDDHPDLANIDFYVGLILGNCGYHEKSVEFLQNTLKLQNKFHGESSITVATTHHLIANSLTHLGSFLEAKQHERKAYTIYRTKLGPEHARTVESYKDIRHITEKHVTYDQTIELAQGLPVNRSNNRAKSSKSHKHD